MKILAGLILAIGLIAADAVTIATKDVDTTTVTTSTKSWQDIKLPIYTRPINPKDALLQEIHTLDEEVANDEIQEEVAKTLKAEAQKSRVRPSIKLTTAAPTTTEGLSTSTASEVLKTTIANATNEEKIKKVLESDDMNYEELLDDDDDDDDDEFDDDEDSYDDDDDDVDDELDDDEEIMSQCPDYCRCAGQYAAATTATCSKLVDEQAFGPGIAHLRIENAGEIRLGPHALRNRGLQQLESITISDTRISELDRTAFDGITYLFAVNLTRNNLREIHPQTFQNNTQLGLLTITNNPLKLSSKNYLFDAPSVSELDLSNNGLTHLPSAAFMKMQSLAYINLQSNRLSSINSSLFDPLEALVELDVSNNKLSHIPEDLFEGRDVQTLRISGNHLTSLSSIKAQMLTTLDASDNKIQVIAKEDLLGIPLLEDLTLRSCGLKRIHDHAFSILSQLTNLDLSDNSLIMLNEHHLRANPRLQTVKLNNNPIGLLPNFKPNNIEYDTYNIYRFECSNCELDYLEAQTFKAMTALTHLNLSKNRLRPKNMSITKGHIFENLTSLRELDLSDNLIDTIEPELFKGATSLTKLNLAGNPLMSMQVAPFLMTPSLTRLDVSRCDLERVWSEARVPLRSLRYLSLRGNLLRRITVEELKAMPKLSGLDITHNPLDCDQDFNSAIQWLTDRGVMPKESQRYISNYGTGDDYAEAKGISQWVDLAKIVCENVIINPPSRDIAKPKDIIDFETTEDTSAQINLLGDLEEKMEAFDKAEEDMKSMDFEKSVIDSMNSIQMPRRFFNWTVFIIVLISSALILLVANFALYIAKRRGRGPVIRPPMILRQGLVDNKNCGLVYKPLQEEIPTPHMPKRGTFYSSSTFHYDKIVPESV